jgi:hypothetical protein
MSIHDRFWSKVNMGEADSCWPWMAALSGGRDGASYGTFRVGSLKDGSRRQEYSHRVAFCLDRGIEIGALAEGIVIRHRCDFKRCCNPRHLIDGFQADNVQDMIDRGQIRRGEQISNAILTADDIPAIRARLSMGHFHHVIADHYGVCRGAISSIATGRTWAWIE